MLNLAIDIACPNCGNEGERQYFLSPAFSRSHCPICDALIVICDRPQKTLKGRKANRRYANKLSTSDLHTIAYRGSKSYE